MKPKVLVAPSLLAADPLRFGEELRAAELAGADWHHVDVMDGHFVPNLTYGLPLVRAIKKRSSIPLDVHIMVSNPDAVALDYVEAGADILVFPLESVVHSHRLIEEIHRKGAKAGVAVNPGTAISALEGLVPFVDLINVMSVNPGFGGQAFIPGTVDRLHLLQKLLRDKGRKEYVLVEVDGGINADTARLVTAAGADVLVAGTFFYNAGDKVAALEILRSRV